ncbi:flavin reductase family protein [Gordonia metallireducens]|uniref:flavin reductase family protein n=1 Tax=Gordonia metallireducens TaxID=2897779 RepID=UPI001E500CD0|nr:flavin reductase family protein [Gordonia metallireducens]
MSTPTATQKKLVDVFGRYASGVTVVTCTNAEGRPHGATVTAFTAVSHDPYLCQVTLTKKSKACQYLDGRPFAVNFLAAEQTSVAMHFAGRPTLPAPVLVDGDEAPYLDDALATVICRPWRTYDAGDHLIFIGEIVETRLHDAEPLLYFARGFHRLTPADPQHAWAGCSDDPLMGWFGEDASFVPAHVVDQPVSSKSLPAHVPARQEANA